MRIAELQNVDGGPALMRLIDLRKKAGQRLCVLEAGSGLGDLPVDFGARREANRSRDRRSLHGFFGTM